MVSGRSSWSHLLALALAGDSEMHSLSIEAALDVVI